MKQRRRDGGNRALEMTLKEQPGRPQSYEKVYHTYAFIDRIEDHPGSTNMRIEASALKG